MFWRGMIEQYAPNIKKAPYIDGAKRLRPEPPEMKSTNYVIDQQIKERLEQLAATEGMPLEIAIRIIVREYLASRENDSASAPIS